MDHITTPFGRRTMTLGMVANQVAARECPDDKASHKWRVFRWITEAKDALGVSDRTLVVLNALLTCLPDTVMTAGLGLIVFASNASLRLRAHGMAETTLRRHLEALVNSGIIIRRDSPNGKRYARRGKDGIEQAFGLDLTPVLARAGEFECLAADVASRRRAAALARERVSIYRRDISKGIEAGRICGLNMDIYADTFVPLNKRLPRHVDPEFIEALASDLHSLAVAVGTLLKDVLETQNMDGNDSHFGAHYLNSKADQKIESEPTTDKPIAEIEPKRQMFPVSMILRACPDITLYDKSEIRSWRDLVATAGVVRGALGISVSAWDDARSAMGDIDAAITIAGILQRTDEIKSPGGYLRGLTERSRERRYSIGPMIMALMRKSAQRSISKSGGT